MRSSRRSFQKLYGVLDDVVNDQVGIVRVVEEIRIEPGAPNFFHFGARACHTQAFTRLQNFSDTGGAAIDRDRAMAKAIGEAVERYCSAIFDVEELPLYSYDSAPFCCAPPEEFALYSRAQYETRDFQFAPFDRQSLVRWFPAVDISRGEEMYVPACMVFVPYIYYLDTGDTPIAQPISTGQACHTSRDAATISAICEVIERDSFTIAWQSRMSPPRIRHESLSDTNLDVVRRFERAGNKVTLFNITLDNNVATILSVLQNPSPGATALTFATSTDLDPEIAVLKSLEELAHTRLYMQYLKMHLPPLNSTSPNVVADQATHLKYYTEHENARFADFLFESRRNVDFEELENQATGSAATDVRRLVDRIRSTDERVLLSDITTPDVAELGFFVMRAIVPGYHRLSMGHRNRPLGGRRLWEIPQKLGYPGVTPETGDNPAPHPFP